MSASASFNTCAALIFGGIGGVNWSTSFDQHRAAPSLWKFSFRIDHPDAYSFYTFPVGLGLISAIRFFWNATSGSRLRPWRSEYLKWRIETYSGMKAESITPLEMFRFTWREKWNLLHFLRWAGKLEKQSIAGRD